MPLITKTLPGIFNGVSQQPETLRLENQLDLQENAMSSVGDGVYKRPPTEWVAELASKANLKTFIHTINRDVNERYIVIISNDIDEPIEIYTLEGEKCTVYYDQDSINYLWLDENGKQITDPRRALRAVTVADHTIIVNRTRIPKMKEETTPVPDPWALVWVKAGYPATDYRVQIMEPDGTVIHDVHVPTLKQDDDDVEESVKTTNIAKQIYDKLTEGPEGFIFKNLGSTILIRREGGKNFQIKVSDSYGNTAIAGFKGAVQKFADLPVEAEDGLVAVISGDPNDNIDDYYVKYTANENGAGVWTETVKPGLKNYLDPKTLPHRLVRTAHNEFTLMPIEWAPRYVGDEFSAPEPSFIGNPINDVFFFKDRLGFLAGENVIFSRAGDYFNLWPHTATDVVDGDPIDTKVATDKVAILYHAVPFVNNLILFSDQQQFSLSSGSGILTPKTVAITPSTAFETAKGCRPVGSGPNLYFVVPSGAHSQVREYFVQPNTVSNNAENTTAHVPRYLPKNVTMLAASSARDIVFALSPDDPHCLYVYRYFWDGDQKVQSAWSKWIFDDEVLNVAVLDDYVYLITKTGNNVSLVRMDLEKNPTPGLHYKVHLDKQVSLVGTYDPINNETTWVLPYDDPSQDFEVVEGRRGNQLVNVVKNGRIIKAPGDHSQYVSWIGKTYTMRFRFSKFYLRDRNGLANTQGHLKVRTITISHTDTGYYRIEADRYTSEFTGTIVGVSRIGQPTISTGTRRFVLIGGVQSGRIEVINDSPLPSQIQYAAYEALWTSRSISV